MDKDDYRIDLVRQHFKNCVSSEIIETIAKNIDPDKYHDQVDQTELGKDIGCIVREKHIDLETTLNMKYHGKPGPYFPGQLKQPEV